MAVDFSIAVENAVLDQIETTLGTAPVLYIYSGAQPAATTDADPSGTLVSWTLPSDWMEAAAGKSKAYKGGAWYSTATGTGTAQSFRLKTSGGTTVIQGSVTAVGGGGDIQLNTTSIATDKRVGITAFTFTAPSSIPPRSGILSKSGAANTIVATGTVYTQAATGPKGVWTLIRTGNTPVVDADLDGWVVGTIDVARDRFYMMDWSSTIHAFDLSTGARTTIGRMSVTEGMSHNRTLIYDPLNDRLWIGNGTGDTGEYMIAWTYWDFGTGLPGTMGTGINEPNYYIFLRYDAAQTRLEGFGESGGRAKYFNLSPIGSAWLNAAAGAAPSLANYNASDRYGSYKSCYDSTRDRYLWVRDYHPTTGAYEPGKIKVLAGDLSAWTEITTTGPYPSPNTLYTYDPVGDQIVGWTGSGTISGGAVVGDTRTTWLCPLTTLQWRKVANNTAGDTVPIAFDMISQSFTWDATRNRAFLIQMSGPNRYYIWSYNPPAATTGTLTKTQDANTLNGQAYIPGAGTPPITGTVQQFDLPQIVAGAIIDGVNYAGLHFNSGYTGAGGDNKHTAQAYCPTNNRVYIQGGDATNSLQADQSSLDSTWSMDVATGAWRFECGRPLKGYVAPSALQDGSAIEWMPVRGQFVTWPGHYAPYGFNVAQYATGHWFYDPFTPDATPSGYTAPQGTWTQYIASPLVDFGDSGSGVYDRNNDLIFAVRDSWSTGASQGGVIKRFSLASQSWLPDVNLNITPLNPGGGYSWALFGASRYVRVGRKVYIVGCWYNGGSQITALWSVDMDTFAVNQLATPPVPGNQLSVKETRLCASNGKVIWPHITDGANGVVLGVYVYDPSSNIWYKETQTVTTRCNSVCTMYDHPEGWAGLCGGGGQTKYTLLKY